MTYVVTDNCILCKHSSCVDICPVDAFHEGKIFIVINPDECVDCNLCVPECPEDAIFAESDLTEQNDHFLRINAELALIWPVILESVLPLDDYEIWSGKPNKIQFLESE